LVTLQHTPLVLNLLPFQCCTLMQLACLMGFEITCFETCMLLPWCCKCCSRGSTGCPLPDLHLATPCCARADSCPVACPSVCTWEAHPSALAMQAAWLWSHQNFPLFIPSIYGTLSLLGSLSFRRTNHLNKISKMLKFLNSEAKFWPSKGP